MSKRRRFKEWEVIETLIRQGVKITCARSGAEITLENVQDLQREHVHELALGGPDQPSNCIYSLTEAHAVVTNGTPATAAGGSIHRIAKTKRLTIACLAKDEVETRVGRDPGFRLKKKMDGSVVRVRTR